MKNSQFYSSLHGLRGAAAIMVFFAHMSDGLREYILDSSNVLIDNMVIGGAFGVQIFFALSGFVISASIAKYDFVHFIKQRFWRIYPLFFVVTAGYFILNLITQYHPDKLEWSYLFFNLIFLDLILSLPTLAPNAWTITYEAWFYLLGYLSFRKINDKPVFQYISVMFFVCFIYIFPYSIFFITGIFVYKIRDPICKLINSCPLLYLRVGEFLFLLFFTVFITKSKVPYSITDLNSVFSILFYAVLILILFSLVISKETFIYRFLSIRYFSFLGSISYSLYLLHPYILKPLQILIPKVYEHGSSSLKLFIYTVTSLVGVLIISYISNKYIEVAIFKRFTKRRIYKN
jgi:peptidoglycan/LPS O-acetylase OafA/YrhL